LRDARPVDRLKRRYTEFQRRLEVAPPDPQEPTTPPAPLRKILGASHTAPPATLSTGGMSRPQPKIQVFTDTGDPEPRPGSAGWESIGTLAERKKENTVAAKPWVGERLPMRGSSAAMSSTGERLVVFRDEV
jgi:checkpoint serine/threonine-protein kinase